MVQRVEILDPLVVGDLVILPFGWGDCRPTLLSPDAEGELVAGALEEIS